MGNNRYPPFLSGRLQNQSNNWEGDVAPLLIKREKKKTETKGNLTSEDISHLSVHLAINKGTFHFLILGCFELRKVKNH